MLVFLSVVIVLVTLAAFMAGLLAFLRDSKKQRNRWFFALSCFLAIWIPSNYIDSTFPKVSSIDLFLKLDYSAALFCAWTLLGFALVYKFTEDNSESGRRGKTFILSSLALNFLFVALIFSNELFTHSLAGNNLHIQYTNLFYFYVCALGLYFLYAGIKLFQKRRIAVGRDRSALNIIYFGFMAAIVLTLLTNLVFPSVVSSHTVVKELNILGYLGLFTMTVCIYVAITAQKLFDIRLVIARSLGYVVSLGVIAVIFSTPVLLATTHLLHVTLSSTTIAFLVVATCVVAVIFQPLKNGFDRLSSRIFDRDYYEIQDVLDKLGNLLVGSVDAHKIEKQSIEILGGALKPLNMRYLLISSLENKSDFEMLQTLKKTRINTVVIDELDSNKYSALHSILGQNNVNAAVRLRTKDEDLGFILVGLKKSGQSYTDMDKRLLTIAADEIAISLQNALRFEEIERFNITLQQKVDEATLKLRRANEKLRALDETKDDFISMASHQLRTPLTSVKGYLSMVLEGDTGKITKTQKDMLGQAFFSSQRMVYLIADLLNVSRLKTGKFIIEPAPVNLAELVNQELKQLVETAATKSLTLSYEQPKEFPTLMLDETKTRQVIMNFADNAIYYTPAGGHITVKLVNNPETIELRVEDNGIGVPKAEQHHLFTKFYRAGNARKARPDGTGLGLFMAKKVIAAEGGSIIFESTEGKGSTFGFVFSKAKLALKPSSKPAKEAEKSKKEELVGV